MRTLILVLTVMLMACIPADGREPSSKWRHMKKIVPQGYVCYRAETAPVIDGKGDDPAWAHAAWTSYFVDIEGDLKPKPRFKTRAKMLWDKDYFYVLADLKEPHVWGKITKKNAVMFQDNDFEVFIDPNGDHHNYYEMELNALGTIWELSLDKPYWDGGPVRNPNNMPGFNSAVHVDGTINDPADTDQGWSTEMAFPWKGLMKYADGVACPPSSGDQWRVNFSRVEWQVTTSDGQYNKVSKREDNWVWSPQGLINMHRPEKWGYVQFSTEAPGKTEFRPDPTLPGRDLLMSVYHAQRIKRSQGGYAATLAALGMEKAPTHESLAKPIELQLTPDGYRATAHVKLPDGSIETLHVRQDSKLWQDENGAE